MGKKSYQFNFLATRNRRLLFLASVVLLSVGVVHRVVSYAVSVRQGCPSLSALSGSLILAKDGQVLQPKVCQNFPSSRRTLNLIFQFSHFPVKEGGNILEFDWILNVLLAKVDRPIRIISNDSLIMDDSLVFMLKRPKNPQYWQDAHEKGYRNIGLFHMGDEQMNVKVTKLYESADYVLRNYYWKPYLDAKKIHYVPLGTRDAFGDPNARNMLPASERKLLCNFMGSVSFNRKDMMTIIESSNLPCFTFKSPSWMNKKNLGATEYRDVMLESKFTLAPAGNNMESMRFWEALQAGSIPVIKLGADERGDFVVGLSTPPVILLEKWEDLPSTLQNLADSPKEIDALQRRVISWFQKYKTETQFRVKGIIDASFGEEPVDDCEP